MSTNSQTNNVPISISIPNIIQESKETKEITVKVEEILTIPKKLKVCVGLSTGKMVNSVFVKTLFERLREWTEKYAIVLCLDEIIPLDLSRNNIVEMARKENCDYLFFIDSDIIIKDGQLDRLLSHEKDAIAGVYYKSTPPHEPLPRKKVAENLYAPIEFEENKDNNLIEIDGTGMGCFLIKTDVFDKIPYPWFEFKYYKKNGKYEQVSEDLLFCQKLQDIGIKIYCDTSVQCLHIGTPVGQELSRLYKEIRTSHAKERDRTAAEISEFIGIPTEDVYEKWRVATELVAKEYIEYKNSNRCSNCLNSNSDSDFYKTNKNYIFDLTSWHLSQRIGFDFELVKNIKKDYPSAKNILDFGSGCGQNAIQLSEAGYEVAMADYNGYTSEFARFRTKKRCLNIKFYDIEKPIDDKFDIILAFDVLEHVPDSEFKQAIELLKSLKRNGGKILTTVSFGTQEGIHPMRYKATPEKLALIEELNK